MDWLVGSEPVKGRCRLSVFLPQLTRADDGRRVARQPTRLSWAASWASSSAPGRSVA
jgi:hypothetical protein